MDKLKDKEGNEIIINDKAVVYFIRNNLGTFKGVAKCHPEDDFDLDVGINIAKSKAEIKYLKKYIKFQIGIGEFKQIQQRGKLIRNSRMFEIDSQEEMCDIMCG